MRPRLAPIALALLLAGCASSEIARQRDDTAAFSQQHFATPLQVQDSEESRRTARHSTDALLTARLTQDAAVRLTLVWSPALQALLADADAASARLTQSARLANPVFAFERMLRQGPGGREVEFTRALSFALLDLLWLPARRDVATQRQEVLRARRAADVVRAVHRTRSAWVEAVAAREALAQHQRAMQAAEAAAELARRMQAAGNFSRLQRLHQQGFYASSSAALADAQRRADSAREQLVRALGLDDADAARLQLPDRLPDLPATLRDIDTLDIQARSERLDLRMVEAELRAVERERGLTRTRSVLAESHLKLISSRETGADPRRGFEIEFPLPVFDTGDAQRAQAQAEVLAAWQRAQQVARDASSQLRQSYADYRAAHALAVHHRDELVPVAQAVSDEMLLKYNGMLIGVFDLLADARNQSAAVVAAIVAKRDFWLADAALQSNLLGQPMQAATPSGAAAPTQEGGGH